MLFSPVSRRYAFGPSLRAFDRLFADAACSAEPQQTTNPDAQDEQAYTLRFDVPGVSREQLNIGIEGSIVRLATVTDAPRQYKAAYELPLDIDVAKSEAKLEHGVLTLKLAKVLPESRATTLTIN